MDTRQKRGGHFRSLADNCDTTTAQGQMMLGFQGRIAEFERAPIAGRTKPGLQSAREQGRGQPKAQGQDRCGYLPADLGPAPCRLFRSAVRQLRHVDPAGAWTKPKLVRAIKGLTQIGLANGERLLARARPLPPNDALAKLVASIVRGRPDISIRQIGAESEALGDRTPRGSRTWSPSSVALQLERARALGFLPATLDGAVQGS